MGGESGDGEVAFWVAQRRRFSLFICRISLDIQGLKIYVGHMMLYLFDDLEDSWISSGKEAEHPVWIVDRSRI